MDVVTGPDGVQVVDFDFNPTSTAGNAFIPAGKHTLYAWIDTACAPMLLGRVLLEAMCDELPDAQARLEEFDARAAARGLFVD